jgi:hypothetical protein
MANLGYFLALTVGAALLLAGLAVAGTSYNERSRQLVRGLRKVLRGEIHAFLIDHGRGCGVGFNFTSHTMAVGWDWGEWCLVYAISEMRGAEIIVDDRVAGWAFADDQLWSASKWENAEELVALRLIFDDAQHPDFVVELWGAGRSDARKGAGPAAAVAAANDWLEGLDALMATARAKRVAAVREAA